MNIKVVEYIREDGSSPWQKWFDSLDAIAAAKVVVAKARMELGNLSNIKWFKGVGEYRIDWGPGYRVYLVQDGPALIILLGGSSKKDQKAAIGKALALHLEYKTRKKQAAINTTGKRTRSCI